MQESSTIAIIGILGTTVGALIWIIKHMFDKILPALESLSKSTDKNTEAAHANTVATKTADKYLRDRNGRDNTMHTELIKAVGRISEKIVETAEVTAKALQETPITQHVETQEVKHQVVTEKKEI